MLRCYPVLLVIAVLGTAIGVFLFMEETPPSLAHGGLHYLLATGLALFGTVLFLAAAPFNYIRRRFARESFAFFFGMGCLAFCGAGLLLLFAGAN